MESQVKKNGKDLRESAHLVSVLVLYDLVGNCTVLKIWEYEDPERGEDYFLLQVGEDRGKVFSAWASFDASRGNLKKLTKWLRISTRLES